MTQYTTSETTREIPYGYCRCGCGGKTNAATKTRHTRGQVKGEPVDYIHGHNGRLDLLERFWSKVDKSDAGGCWTWTFGKYAAGYGTFMYLGKSRLAHRIAYELSVGPIPEGLEVCHSCDNRACVNPSHLFTGTQTDNVKDCVTKGRTCQGEKRKDAKLTGVQVREIRNRYATSCISQRELALEYDITQAVISRVIHRKTWKHIP
jgi:hypothetical protein